MNSWNLSSFTFTDFLLLQCSESRYLASKLYKLCFATESYGPTIYFRFDLDVLYFVDWLSCSKFESNGWFEHVSIGPLGKKGVGQKELHSITQVAVNQCFFDNAKNSFPGCKLRYFLFACLPLLQRFTALKKLFFVLDEVDPYDRGEINFFSIPYGSHLHRSLIGNGCHHPSIVTYSPVLEPSSISVAAEIVTVGAARGNLISHAGTYQVCPCAGVQVDFASAKFDARSCFDFSPDSTEVECDAEADSLEESEETILDPTEIDDLLRDEENYLHFVENNCAKKYGVKHEEWFGHEYLR